MKDLISKISNLEAERSKLWKDIEPLQTRVVKISEELEPLRNELATLKLAQRKDKNAVDPDIVLQGDPQSMVMHREKERLLATLGLRSNGYFPDSGQTCLEIALIKGDSALTQKVYNGLCFLLPYLLPYKNTESEILISIFEHTLSRYTSYNLHIDGNSPTDSCYIRAGYSTKAEFDNLKDALNYIEKNLWYETLEPHSENLEEEY